MWRTKKTTLTSWTFPTTHVSPTTIKQSLPKYKKAIILRLTQLIASRLKMSTDSNQDKMRRPLVPETSTRSQASCKAQIPHLHAVWPRHPRGQLRKNWYLWTKKWRQQPKILSKIWISNAPHATQCTQTIGSPTGVTQNWETVDFAATLQT